MRNKKIILIISVFLISLILLSGCLGFGEGYVKKAQEMTSADYVIGQYKFFIEKYNTVRQMGSMIVTGQRNMESYKKDHGNPQFWTMTENNNYEDLRFATNGYISQYNKFATDYNSRMRDITTNQKWMKPENFPDYIELYVEGRSVVTEENNQTLVQPNEVPQAPPDWVPPRT
jgi:hypothetical protein